MRRSTNLTLALLLVARLAVAATPCQQADDLVARGLGLEFAGTCDGECLRQKTYFYGRAAALCPTHAVALNNLGYVYERAGQLVAARAQYEEARRADTRFAPAYFGLGDVALTEGRYGEAITSYERGLKEEADEPVAECRLKLARAYAAGNPAESDLLTTCFTDAPLRARGPDPVLVTSSRFAVQLRFGGREAEIDATARAQLKEVARALNGDRLRAKRFVVEGHADEGEEPGADTLSQRRAEAVRDVLLVGGVEANRLVVRGFGTSRPAVVGDGAANRRVEIAQASASDGEGRAPLALAAAVLVEGEEGRLAPLTAGGSVPSGGRYAVRFSTPEPAHAYAVQEDSGGHLVRLFPSPSGGGKNPVRAKTDYYLPGGDQLFQLDDVTGSERIFVVATRVPARDIEDLLQRLDTAADAGTVHELVLQIRSRGVAGVVAGRPTAGREALSVALAHHEGDGALTVIEFAHVPRVHAQGR